MTWNYRVVKQIHHSPSGDEILFQIHEVYCDGDTGDMTENPVPLVSETIEGLKEVLERIGEALEMPVLDYDAV